MPAALPFLRAALKRRRKLSYHTRGEEVNFLWKFRTTAKGAGSGGGGLHSDETMVK